MSEIPQGKVASYKQIAILAGHPQNARLVGKILSHAAETILEKVDLSLDEFIKYVEDIHKEKS